MFKKISLFLACSFLFACNVDFQQDPFSNASDIVKRGVPPDLAEKPETAKKDENVFMHPASIGQFKEGVENRIRFSAGCLYKNYTPFVVIDNLSEFPGATFDDQTGEFVWTPQKGFVKNGEMSIVQIRAIAMANPDNSELGVIKSGVSAYNLTVIRDIKIPTVTKVSNLTSGLWREGQVHSLKVIIRDEDSGSGPNEMPSLSILPPNHIKLKSLAPFATIAGSARKSNGIDWEFVVNVDLSSAELTNSSVDAGLAFQVSNQFNRKSPVLSHDSLNNLKIYTSFANLQHTWTANTEVIPSQDNTIPFLVFDPKGEQQLSFDGAINGLPVDAKITCSGPAIGTMGCVFKWRPSENQGEYSLTGNIKVIGKNIDKSDATANTIVIPISLKVLASPQPDPTPAPALNVQSQKSSITHKSGASR